MMRVCLLGVFDPDYPRNDIIRVGLERAGCRVMLHRLPPRRSALQSLPDLIRVFPLLSRKCDVIIVAAFNALLAPFIQILGRTYSKPIWLDYMVGLTDAQEDRQQASGFKSLIYRRVDIFNTQRTKTFTDTQAHRQAFERLLRRDMNNMSILPVGVRDSMVQSQGFKHRSNNLQTTVQFVGTYIPFHGTDIIVKAAYLLRNEPRISFEMIGKGQTYRQTVALAQELEVQNIRFVPGFFDSSTLLPMLTRSGIFLGVFGDTEKTRYVVPNKVYEGMALGVPVITAESPALMEYFTPGEHLVAVPPGNPQALAAAIERIATSPEEAAQIGKSAAARIRKAFTPEHIGGQLKSIIEESMSDVKSSK